MTERKWDEQQEGLEQGAPVPGTSLSKVITEQGQAFESFLRVTHRDSHHYKAFYQPSLEQMDELLHKQIEV